MTATATPPSGTPEAPQAAPKPDQVTLSIDGLPVSVPKGTLIIRAAEQIGIQIPRSTARYATRVASAPCRTRR